MTDWYNNDAEQVKKVKQARQAKRKRSIWSKAEVGRALINPFTSAPRGILSGPMMKKRQPINRRCAIPVSVFLTGVAAISDIPPEK